MSIRVVTQQAIQGFAHYLTENERAEATTRKYVRDVGRFAAYAAGRRVDKELVLLYKEQLEQHYTIRSANSMLAALNAFLRFTGWHELCVKQFKLQKEAYCSAEKELTRQEYTALVKTAERTRDKRLSLVVQTICATGIRVSELSSITVEAVRRGEALSTCKGKSRKIFIVKALQKKLLRYAAAHGIESGPLFVTKRGKPLNRSNIWRQMKALCAMAGVLPQKVFPHNLRHLFARTFYNLEKDLAKLADILGHANINTTRIYIITTGAEHRRRMEHLRLVL